MKWFGNICLAGIALVVFLSTRAALGYVELTRHGFPNCIACHVSPDGGGVLTPYGRQLSEEILSFASRKEESKFLYAFTPPDWLQLGGDIQALQLYQKTDRFREARFIHMQSDVEAALSSKPWVLDLSLGSQSKGSQNFSGGIIFSRRHYVGYRPQDELSFRVGRFMPAYGINLPDHTVVTRRDLKWDEGGEAYNLEGAWLGKNMDFFMTVVFGRLDAPKLKRERGVALRGSRFFGDGFKVGASYFFGDSDVGSRHFFGPWGILGFSKHFSVMVEIDAGREIPRTGESHWGLVHLVQIDYEPFRGIHVFALEEFSKLDLTDYKNTLQSFGLGVTFFPRPHWEISAAWKKRRWLVLSSQSYDLGWLQVHFYL